jgi:DNA-binding SARP family transcriptional activator
MRFRILGPVRARSDTAGWVGVPADQQRVVLAVLLAEAGRTVSTDRLIDAVWSDRPPRRAVNTVQVYVMRLGRRIGDDVVTTRGHGDELVAGAGDIDASAFERLVAAGRRELREGRPRIRNGRNLGERVDPSLTSRQRRPLDEINLAIADLRGSIGVRTVLEMGP